MKKPGTKPEGAVKGPGPRPEATRLITRGARRHLADLGWESLPEYAPTRGLRLDLMAVNAQGRFWAVEVKSSLEDWRADLKWPRYLDWCDALSIAVGPDFPIELLPEPLGVIRADGYGAAIVRPAGETLLAPQRRQALLRRFALTAAQRLRAAEDPPLG